MKIAYHKQKMRRIIQNKIAKTTILCAMTLLLIFPLSVFPVSALCDVDFVNYYGTCTDDGDLRIVDSEGNVLMEQLYTVNRACYNGNYHIAVPGGSGDDCQIREGNLIQFQVSGVTMGYSEWSSSSKVVELNLERPKYKEARGEIISTTTLYFIITIMALLVVIITILEFFRKRRK